MSSSLPGQVTFTAVHIPSSLDETILATDFIAAVDVRNAIILDATGRADELRSPAQLLSGFQPTPFLSRFLWLIRLDGNIVGRIELNVPGEGALPAGDASVEVLPPFRDRGIGSLALLFLEDRARAAALTSLHGGIEHRGSALTLIVSPTGHGAVPADHGARFAIRHGYVLEQVERVSHFTLTDADASLRALLQDAERHSEGYRVFQWVVDADRSTPEQHIDDYAAIKARMSIDAPSGNIDVGDAEWNADRVRQLDRRAAETGLRVLVTVAEHTASGTLCALNELVITSDNPTIAQSDTLVLADHRGKRLGMRVKCAGLLTVATLAPHAQRVITWNAEENGPMLAVNEAIGFRPIAYEGVWQKRLATV